MHRFTAVLALICAGLLVGCGSDDDDGATSTVKGVGIEQAGSVAPLAQCSDWNAGSDEAQLATIVDVRSQINLEEGTGEAPSLSDEETRTLFDNACSEKFAQSFRLYVIYARAAGFAPLTRDVLPSPSE